VTTPRRNCAYGTRPKTPDHRARAALDTWLPVVRRHLGDSLVSAILFGGAALGEFAPRWSDVDVCVAVREEPPAALHRDLRTLAARFVDGGEGGWESGQFVESALVPVEELVRGGTGRLGAFDLHQIARFGRLLEGDPIEVPAPGRDALIAAQREDLRAVESPRTDRPIWLAGTLQHLARALVFWRDGEYVPKSVALEREIAAGSPHRGAFRLALRLRREGSRSCADHLEELRAGFAEAAPPLATEIRRRLG